jgi:hypothetical protein
MGEKTKTDDGTLAGQVIDTMYPYYVKLIENNNGWDNYDVIFTEYFKKHNTQNLVFEFLPYHEYGKGKWKTEYKVQNGFITKECLENFMNAFEANGLKIINT